MCLNVNSGERRDVRYEINGGQRALLTVFPEDYRCEPQVLTAQLLNLSQNGARLSVPVELPLSRSLRLHLAIEEFALMFYLRAEVCWSAPRDQGGWEIGCCLNPGIPSTLFAVLAKGGRLDRRHAARYKDGRKLLAIREIDGEKHEVTLRDYSGGGFCALAQHAGTPGERIHIFVDGPERRMIVAKIQWQMTLDDRYLLGCTYLNKNDSPFLLEASACESNAQ